jgi:hypothetical protein
MTGSTGLPAMANGLAAMTDHTRYRSWPKIAELGELRRNQGTLLFEVG